MLQSELKEKMISILDQSNIGTLATIKENKPHSRYMMFDHDGLTLYTATDKQTHKVDDLTKNPNVHLLITPDKKSTSHVHLEIEAKATLHESEAMKEKHWNDHYKPWLKGPHDPNLVIIELEPTQIHYVSGNNGESETLRLS